MSLEQNPPLNIQVDPKTWKFLTLANWIHHLIRISQEYKEAVTAFYIILKEEKGNTKKQTYELWRHKAGEHRSYTETNKLAKVRRDIMKKNRLTAAETEEITMKIRQLINTEQQNSEDARVR